MNVEISNCKELLHLFLLIGQVNRLNRLSELEINGMRRFGTHTFGKERGTLDKKRHGLYEWTVFEETISEMQIF